MGTPDFLASELVSSEAATSGFHVIPVPLERSVSYGGGTAGGPAAILEASQQLETWDGRSVPMELGIHTTAAVDCHGPLEAVLARIGRPVARALDCGAIPVLLGGEHTVTLGSAQILAKRIADPVGLLQLDAHADLRDQYEGDRFSHASVMRRCHQDLGWQLFQFGVRALCLEEVRYREERGVLHCDAAAFYRSGGRIPTLPASFPDHLYLTLDVDGLDPSVIRATGTPVPGGMEWHATLQVLESLIAGRVVIGFDVVELAPNVGDHASNFAAAQLVYSVMGLIQRNRQS